MKPVFLGPLAVLLVACAWGLQRQCTESRVRHELDALGPLAAQADRLAREIEAWRHLDPDIAELDRLRARKLELLRLRGEIGDLRQAARRSPEAVQSELQELRSRADTARAETERLEGMLRFEDQSKEVMNALLHAVAILRRIAAQSRDGSLPASWDHIRQRLDSSTLDHPDWNDAQRQQARRHLLGQLDAIPADRFELMPPQHHAHDPGAHEVNNRTILLRERTPRPHPDGGWARGYGFLSGRLAEAVSPDGDFTAWERAETSPEESR